MSFDAHRWIWQQSLTGSEKLVLLKVAHHADPDGTNSYPSVDSIVRDTGIGKRQVQRHLKSFVDRGFLAIDDHEKGGRGHTRTYRFTFAKGDSQMSPFDEPERVTSGAGASEKGDISDQERVTSETEKGDIHAGANITHPDLPNDPPKNIPPNPQPKSKDGMTDDQRERFQRWYDIYPRKVERKRAVKAWIAIDPDDELVEQMIAVTEAWSASDSWDQQRFIPHPASWLNGERWTDGPPPPPVRPGSMTIHQGGRAGGERVGKDGLTDSERGWREDPGHKGWSAAEMMRMAIAMERDDNERNSA